MMLSSYNPDFSSRSQRKLNYKVTGMSDNGGLGRHSIRW